jgi:hypothetical protein
LAQRCEIATHESFLFRPTPLLELALVFDGIGYPIKPLRKD